MPVKLQLKSSLRYSQWVVNHRGRGRMLFLTYWELNENMPATEHMGVVRAHVSGLELGQQNPPL